MTLFQRTLAASAVAATLAAALTLPAFAQGPVPTQEAMGATTATAAPQAHRHGAMKERHQAHQAQRLADLKAKLQITPAQEAAWTTFTAALQPAERPAGMDRQALQSLPTPERIDRMRALRAEHMAAMDRRGDATKAFYAQLSPTQQQAFDAFRPHRGQHGQHGHKGRHHGGMEGMGGHGGHQGHHGQRTPS